ncbi:MAG TPA: FAD:protein FMN transferase [Thermoanaerobaculia bacterium]|nr:FAD:protein FMN transferase [Thermoanaerobaculia bacterium]
MKLAAILLVALTAFPAGALQRARYLMGTVCEMAVDGAKNADVQIEAAFAEAKRVEAMLSTWTDESELARLNRGEAEASPELRALLDTTLEWAKRTGGAFDPRIRHLVVRNGAPLGGPRGQFEEGAFGKGYAIDRMLARIDAPRVLIDFGGQLAVRGQTRVTIADPAKRQQPVLALTMSDGSLSTSGSSEQLHIMDPRTEKLLPARGSVSVIAGDALTADILSTALYVMGDDEGLRWADVHGVAAIFITPARHIRLSAACRERVRGLRVIDRNFELKD